MTATVKRCGNCAYWGVWFRSRDAVEIAMCARHGGSGAPYAQDQTTAHQTCRAWEQWRTEASDEA